VCIENSERAAKTHSDAESDCVDEGRRLPTGGEISSFRRVSGITLTSGNWTDDLADITAAFTYFVVTQTGNGAVRASDSRVYRCVAGPTIE
jgi:hypothetical protein